MIWICDELYRYVYSFVGPRLDALPMLYSVVVFEEGSKLSMVLKKREV